MQRIGLLIGCVFSILAQADALNINTADTLVIDGYENSRFWDVVCSANEKSVCYMVVSATRLVADAEQQDVLLYELNQDGHIDKVASLSYPQKISRVKVTRSNSAVVAQLSGSQGNVGLVLFDTRHGRATNITDYISRFGDQGQFIAASMERDHEAVMLYGHNHKLELISVDVLAGKKARQQSLLLPADEHVSILDFSAVAGGYLVVGAGQEQGRRYGVAMMALDSGASDDHYRLVNNYYYAVKAKGRHLLAFGNSIVKDDSVVSVFEGSGPGYKHKGDFQFSKAGGLNIDNGVMCDKYVYEISADGSNKFTRMHIIFHGISQASAANPKTTPATIVVNANTPILFQSARIFSINHQAFLLLNAGELNSSSRQLETRIIMTKVIGIADC
ncbi:MAG: hypothetical protein GYB33_12990 [Gammaproteobacteria bacterium]|nr:hypothetical protein [Gammaproteobacteria bacterium]